MQLLRPIFFILILLVTSFTPVRSAEIAVLMSSDAKVYADALEGFSEVVRDQTVTVQTLSGHPDEQRDQLKKLRSVIEPDILFVIGTSALQAVAGEINHIPIVHAMVFNPFRILPNSGKNITGISMSPSAEQTIALLRELNPKYHRVGIMLDSSKSEPAFLQVRSVFQRRRLQLVARDIRSVSAIGGALKSLEDKIDILWLWPDETVLTDEVLQRIFLFSFTRKVPVLGLTERHTEMGALLSLSYGNAKDMGRQAGETIKRLLDHSKPAAASQITPRQLKLTVNFKTARKLDVPLPNTIIRRADNVVKAPVYRDGDWWVFRIEIIDASGAPKTEVHRVVYNQDRFETEDPSFLTGGDSPGTPTFLPFASVYLTDPAKKWLDFPLIPGKKWSFRYKQIAFRQSGTPRTEIGMVYAHAEVIGKPPHLVKTAAGNFETVEIWRTEQVPNRAELTYFYSPQTQSVVKLRAEIFGGQQFQLELIAHGNAGHVASGSR
jgi:putative tryptophan/tyrosine transport system substrate-binding protein